MNILNTWKIICFAAIAMGAASCATGPTQYSPSPAGKYGFHTGQIEEDRFQVGFTGRSAHEARDLVLLRAAEITLEQGYDRFRVIGSDLHGNENQGSPVSTSIGFGLGSGGYHRRSRTNIGIGIGIHDVARALNGNKMTASLEIRLLKGIGASNAKDDDTYNAKHILNAIGPKVFDAPEQAEINH